jgi:hypothetical protein
MINIFFLQEKAPKEIHAILTETLACFLSGRARICQHPMYVPCPLLINFNPLKTKSNLDYI